MIGLDGLAMLALSNFIIVITGGLSFAWSTIHVFRVAKNSPSSVDSNETILVFGICLENGAPGGDYILRLDKAHKLLRQNESATIIILGGAKGPEDRSEAYEGRRYLINKGAPESRILIEDKSRNTLENLKEVRREHPLLIKKSLPIFVTNRYHLARCGALAEGLGIDNHLCSAEERLDFNLKTVALILKEGLYLHWYYVGKIFSTVTNNKTMLKRIT
ncbi:hypothetical protein MNBD_NITROSPINAE02-1397 [hydrothermal vent metagenome]|uniref:DUF218 domain-containing protein n=1 Tax=hydrothermal vent metagenome TaxID=652676 RepID=A0A3B1BVJ5_9ZZZZ